MTATVSGGSRSGTAAAKKAVDPVLAEMTEQTHRDVQGRGVRWLPVPVYGPDTLRFLQVQHRVLLEAIEDGDPEAAMDHARAHRRFVRDSIVAVLSN
ncbi:MAG TPA: FCD domain-containing protein [Chloroflexota bacterium]